MVTMAHHQLLLALTLAIFSFKGCYSQGCGIATLNTKIVGGEEASPGSWPWQTSLAFNDTQHFCGGSLITDQWILTAAHCVFQGIENVTTVYLGRHTFSDPNNSYEVSRNIDSVVCHPEYNQTGGLENDICLLKLSDPVSFGAYIQPVCLAARGSTFNTGLTSWITGWGALDDAATSFPDALQEVQVPIVGDNECSCLNVFPIPDKTICAGYDEGGKDACAGDSGGPQVVQLNSVWIQAGIVSFGDGCAKPNKPGVYTRVSEYQDWIQSAVGSYTPPGFVRFNSSGEDSDLNFICQNRNYSDNDYFYHVLDSGDRPRFSQLLSLCSMALFHLLMGY